MNKSRCMEYRYRHSDEPCDLPASFLGRTPVGNTPVCDAHAKRYARKDKITPEMDARIADLQTPEGAARANAERQRFYSDACAKLLAQHEPHVRAMRLLRERRCAFCEKKVHLNDVLEFASYLDSRLEYPTNDPAWKPIAYLAHGECSPIDGYWFCLENLTRRSVTAEWRDHLSEKTWNSPLYTEAMDSAARK